MKIKVGVIFGGATVEHEVSIITSVQAMNNIDKEKYDIIPIYIGKDRTWYTGKMLMELDIFKDLDLLKKYAKKVTLVKVNEQFYLQNITGIFKKNVEQIDIAFPIVHGKGVEDGSLAGYLDSIGVPYVGPSILGASVGQDKVVMKQILQSANIPIPNYTWFYENEYLCDSTNILNEIKKIGYPVIIKPANLGSSVGIKVAKDENEIDNCITDALKYDNKIIVEEIIENLLEVNCSVLGNYEFSQTSAIAQMNTNNDFLTFEDKYIGKSKKPFKTSNKINSTGMIIPANIDNKTEETVKELSLETFKVLNLSGVARIDFLINNKTKKVYVNEPNTIPGSLSFYLWKQVGKDYKTLLNDMICLAIKDYKNKSKKITSFDSNILATFNGSKGMKGKLK
ncbi:MAG: D-alanine--D-alanine ligase family protein [Bacilli bacterium]